MYFSEEIKLYYEVQLAPLFLSCTLAIMKFIFLNFFLDKVLVSALSWEISIDLSFLNKAINKIHAECALCV